MVSIVSIGVWYFFQPSPAQAEDKYVNVYCWYGLLDQDTIKEFENEAVQFYAEFIADNS